MCHILKLYSISRIQHDLEKLRLRCTQLESSLSTTMAELQHLREVNQRAQTDMKKVLDTVSAWTESTIPQTSTTLSTDDMMLV